MEDLWPDFSEIAPYKTPISIIKEHASKLADKTNYMISADLEKDDITKLIYYFTDNGSIKSLTPPFQYNFYLIAQALDYRYKLFSIGHDIFLYPIYFFDIDKDIINEFYPALDGALSINSETDLLAFLKNIFGAKKTIKVIQALISQVS